MEILKHQIRRSFNRAKITYDHHCQLQIDTAQQLLKMLHLHKISADKILDLGCGTGQVTQMLSAAYPHQLLFGIDLADDLLNVARARLSNTATVLCADFDKIPMSSQQFNLAFSNMALQWSINFSSTLQEISRILQNQGCVALTLPVEGTFSHLKRTLLQLTGQCYLNEFAPISRMTQALTDHGFIVIDSEIQHYSSQFLSLTAALNSMKKIGALINNGHASFTKSMYRLAYQQETQLDYQIATIVAQKICH